MSALAWIFWAVLLPLGLHILLRLRRMDLRAEIYRALRDMGGRALAVEICTRIKTNTSQSVELRAVRAELDHMKTDGIVNWEWYDGTANSNWMRQQVFELI